MTAWRSSVTQQKKLGLPAPPHMPVVHDAGKALWRGLEPILCASDEGDSRPGLIRWLEEIRTEILESEKHVLDLVTIHAQGMTYGTQSSVFETGIDDTLSLNSVMFRHDYSGIASVLDVVKCTDGAVLALSQFVRNLRAASGDKGKSTETAEQVREWAYADLDGLFRDELGKRTKGVVTLIADSITSKRPDLAESAEGLAQKVMAAAGFKVKASDRAGADKGSLATDYLIFIANNEIDKLADLAIAAFDEGEDVSKMKKEVSAIFHGPQAVDIALFGRMLADAPDLNTDASAQVAHAFSIDQITPEYDYFTAVDDCASEDNAGAAMIDTVGFNSSTLYRYATVNIDVLRDQLQDDSATVEGVVAFVEAFVKSMPSGKQNTFANHTLPEDVVVTLRESQPISAADAFEDPVRRKDGISVSRQGVERLGERLNDIRVNYGEEPVKAWYVATGGAVSSLNEWCEQVSLPDLEQSLKETLNAAYSA